jgi:hypothetical protein
MTAGCNVLIAMCDISLIGQPSYLWSDGHGYKGKGDDAFGVWRFPF